MQPVIALWRRLVLSIDGLRFFLPAIVIASSVAPQVDANPAYLTAAIVVLYKAAVRLSRFGLAVRP